MKAKLKRKVVAFWEWLHDEGPRLREEFDPWFEEVAAQPELLGSFGGPIPAVSEIQKRVDDTVGRALLHVVAGPLREGDERELLIRPHGQHKRLDLTVDFHACRSGIEIAGWLVLGFMPAGSLPPDGRIHYRNGKYWAALDTHAMRFITKPSIDKVDRLDIFFLHREPIPASGDDGVLAGLLEVLDTVLGEYGTMRWVGSVEHAPPPTEIPGLGDPVSAVPGAYKTWGDLEPAERARKREQQRKRETERTP